MTDTVRPLHTQEPPPDNDWDTTPPDDQQAAQTAERLLLGTLLLNPDQATTILPVIDPAQFATPAHETIWHAAEQITAAGHHPDHTALLAHLAGDRIFTRAGGARLLTDLVTAALGTTPQPELHAQIIRDGAAFRRVDHLLTQLRIARREVDTTTTHHVLEQLGDLAHTAAATFGPTTTNTATGLKDLTWVLEGTPPHVDPPVYVQRTDGTALFYAAQVNGLFGDPESGKTWVAQTAIVEALAAGGTAAMIDVDHNGQNHTAARLLRLGATLEDLANPTRFRYYEPEDGDQLRAASSAITSWAPNVVIIDSLGEILPMIGVSSIDNDEITNALRTIVQPPATAGSCVITIDHLPKSHEARSTGFAIGGTAKKRVIRGSYLRVDTKVKPIPGGVGRAMLFIEKDTAGELRKACGGGYAGTFTLDSTHELITTWRVGNDEKPTNPDGSFRPTILMERVSRYLDDNPQSTHRDIVKNVVGKDKHVGEAVRILLQDGYVGTIDGPRGAKLHQNLSHYIATEDDRAQPEHQPTWGQPKTDPDDPALWGKN